MSEMWRGWLESEVGAGNRCGIVLHLGQMRVNDERTNDRSGSQVGAGSALSLEVSVAGSAVGSVLLVFSFLLIVEGVWS